MLTKKLLDQLKNRLINVPEFKEHLQNKLPIEEPPCNDCKWFKPRVATDSLGNFSGIILCTTPGKMHRDFSCYNKEEDNV